MMNLRTFLSAAALALAVSAIPLRGLGALISLDVRDLDVYDAVRLLSTQGGVNVVVDSSVPHHPVTLRLVNVSFEQALQTLARTNDLESARVGGIIYLGPGDVINRRYPAGSATGARTQVFVVRNASSDQVAKGLAQALPQGTVIVADPRTGTILVSGSPGTLERAHDLRRLLLINIVRSGEYGASGRCGQGPALGRLPVVTAASAPPGCR
jgi:type II secretory pathway component HofQ